CGFVLMKEMEPAAYALCSVEDDILVYQYTEYNPKYEKHSPGIVLFLLILKVMFEQNEITFMDIGGNGTWRQKSLFATNSVNCNTVMWFPRSSKHTSLVLAHLFVFQMWRIGACLKSLARRALRSLSKLAITINLIGWPSCDVAAPCLV